MIQKDDIKDIYELSPLQKGILFHYLKDPSSHAYFQQMTLTIQGKFQVDDMEDSLNALIKKHDILRTVFMHKQFKNPMQVVWKERKANISFQDISSLQEKEKQAYVDRFLEEDKRKGFDLSSDLLLRFSVIQTGEETYQMIWSHHHILIDGWCLGVLFKELFDFYEQKYHGQPISTIEGIPYSVYVKWLRKQDKQQSIDFWNEYIAGYEEVRGLPRQSNYEKEENYERGTHRFRLTEQMTSSFSQWARQHGVTMSTAFQTIWGLLLQKYQNTSDILFGKVVAGRPAQIEHIEKMVGLFINTIPTRMHTDPNDTVIDAMKKMQQQAVDADAHEYISLSEMKTDQQPCSQLIDHIMVIENYPLDLETLNRETLPFQVVNLQAFEQTNYNLCVTVYPMEQLEVDLTYNQKVYDTEFMQHIQLHIETLITTLLAHPSISIQEIEITSEKEKEQLLHTFNQTEQDYPRTITAQEMFEQQVLRTPNHVALVFENEQVTYAELNEKANQLARHLRKRGVTKNEFVAIMSDRSIEMIVALLAILKAGGAYVPIDHTYPVERITYMLEDSGARLLLKQSALPSVESFKGETMNIEDAPWYTGDVENVTPINTAQDLAYMIYTSGSTGKPKGVMIEHQSLCGVSLMCHTFDLTVGTRVCQTASISFDSSVFQIFCSLFNGAKLYLVKKEFMLSGASFVQWMKEKRIQLVDFVPSFLRALPYEQLPDLRVIGVGGEVVTKDLVSLWGQGRKFINSYGPTEATIDSTTAVVTPEMDQVFIGKPISNKKVYILNDQLQLQPIGVVGELCIGGEGLAKGYWKREALTKNKFIDNPFVPNEKLYRSGDLAKFHPDGNIEYVGRKDHQVKVRGFRIETEEIEKVLASHPALSHVTVKVYTNEGTNELCAYVVKNTSCSTSELKQYMKLKLPSYMVPLYFVELQAIPLTANGKVDRNKLPDPILVSTDEMVKPKNEVETQLLDIWKEVLSIKSISTTDNFFDLGGNSIKVMTLHALMYKKFQIDIPFKAIFEHPTIVKLASRMKSMQTSSYDMIQAVEERDLYPISSVQQRMYAIQQIDGVGTSYNIPYLLHLHGEFDVNKWEKAMMQFIQRHEALRTSFHVNDGQLWQKVHESIPFHLDVREVEQHQLNDVILSLIQPFTLNIAPLFRAYLFKISEKHHAFFIDMHHIISDGASVDILLSELMKLYEGETLQPLPIQYKDYTAWHQQYLQSEKVNEHEAFWLNQFKYSVPTLQLHTDFPRPSMKQYDGDIVTFSLSQDLSSKLRAVMHQEKISLFSILLAAYNVFLSKYTGQEDIVVGTPISGRYHPDVNNIFGMFANTIALRNYPEGSQTFQHFMQKVKQMVIEAFDHADYPFEQLVEKLKLPRNVSRSALFDTMLIVVNETEKHTHSHNLTYEKQNTLWKNSKFDLSWYVEEKDQLEVTVEYSTHLFHRETIERMTVHFEHILTQLLQHPMQQLQHVQMITTEESEQILFSFNNNEPVYYPVHQPLHYIFEQQATKTPYKTALIANHEQLTYKQVNEKANQLAHTLQRRGVGRNTVVGLCVERSIDMMISILAILKAGGAYMPISPDYPTDRIQYMIENSEVRLVLVHHHTNTFLSSLPVDAVHVNDETSYSQHTHNLPHRNEQHDLAYVLYTSGSTGRPKGVMIEHHTVINRIGWMVKQYDISESDVLLQKTPFAFDVSVWEIFMWFFAGSTLCLLKHGEEKSPEHMLNTIAKHHVTAIHFVPSMLNGFLDYMEIPHNVEKASSLRRVFASGEALLPQQVERFYQWLPHAHLYNLYGPTEATIDVSHFHCSPQEKFRSVPIGKPLDNVQLYVLNAVEQLQPIGVAGELCISGTCLARGYMNREDLTAEKFVNNPFKIGEKMYKTGDLARWLPDGNIEYLGRIDNQVKIRGLRIELDEIHSVLLQCDQVKDGAVVAVKDDSGTDMLCAYIVPSQKRFSIQVIREHLGKTLPEYMIPAHFMEIEQLPLTHNGKLDRKALPRVVMQQRDYVAPDNEMESVLLQTWQEVLHVESVGTTDNFFEYGGDSIKAIHVIASLSKRGLKLDMSNLFKYPSIKQLAPFIQQKDHDIHQGLVTGEVELTPIQHWFYEKKLLNKHHWNQSILLHSEDGIDMEICEKAFLHCIGHHDGLRLIFPIVDEQVKQEHQPVTREVFHDHSFHIKADENISERIEMEANTLHRSLNIETGPLLAMAHFHTVQGDYLLCVVHHLIVDGVSWRILIEDFSQCYEQLEQGEDVRLPDKTTSYQDWAKQIQTYANSDAMVEEISYWQQLEQVKLTHLPQEKVEQKVGVSEQYKVVSIEFDKALTEQLLTNANQAYHTEINDLLLSALAITMKDWTGERQLGIHLEGHGREDIIDGVDLTRTIGWFTSLYPVVIQWSDDESISNVIKSVKETLRRIPNKGLGYGIYKYLMNKEHFDQKESTLQPNMLFNYLGQFDQQNENDRFHLSNLPTGNDSSVEVEDAHVLNINGAVIQNQLVFHFQYDALRLSQQSVLQWSEKFKHHVKNLVHHCVNKKESEVTPSDFSAKKLSSEELDDVFELLG
ncbi:non-ribosomal peptide synthetase [Longirhabdus pacifica]|uniref:non-ribosomal peptide synthetase n=1 Tax=Longirhabdus pacifica TaxID=2305227 RepID=UPI001008B156|nr:non-ribosomal peptide synthetase [Longirhabdus pacifica]